ncbi:MAG: glycoside hydrolase family 3 C-terminal domain-containing protein [Treponema sp.]|jgi:beta-glucosidase|nr:glycoside hydrolase family 3 C-terminal domain-containing protein [Treponema sp.]
MTSGEILAELTPEEKASLCSGLDFWNLKSVTRLGLSSIMVTDGPHGLRKQAGKSDHLGIGDSVPATCFPVASAMACSFDRDLLVEVGGAIAEECLAERVSVILGPGANIKRSPLCGRNFEYFSEDPFLTGEMAAALIKGIQQKGVGTSLKHYAANNQETRRMTSDSVVDERALREIYLAGFERAVKKSGPWTVMCSYNRLNGTYACENKRLLSGILRDEWGFRGLVMTDWGAMDDRVDAVKASLDLEMPGSGGYNDMKILKALKSGVLSEGELDPVVLRIIELILASQKNLERHKGASCDMAAHHALARKAAAKSAVLLKNEGMLPIAPGKSIAVIGAFAKVPRYQGAGSSKINPTRLEGAFDALRAAGFEAEYEPGYEAAAGADMTALIEKAASLAAKKDAAIVFAGLPDEYESEGFDRSSLDMPESHNKLIEAVAAANPNTAVVLHLGAPVLLPWADKVKGILLMYLGGQASGAAAADLLSGAANPEGRLAETWPLSLEDTPPYRYYPGKGKTAEYRESIFVGYRHYDAAAKDTAYPFGYGLSYTSFEYSRLELEGASFKKGGALRAGVTVKNTGNREGAETVQFYVAAKSSAILRAPRELKEFVKVSLKPGESATVNVTLDERSFAYYNAPHARWALEGGTYTVFACSGSAGTCLGADIEVEGDGLEKALAPLREKAADYFSQGKGEFAVSGAAFEALLGRPLPPAERKPGEPFTVNDSLEDIKDTETGRQMAENFRAAAAAQAGGDPGLRLMMEKMVMEMPLRSISMLSPDLTPEKVEAVIGSINADNIGNTGNAG